MDKKTQSQSLALLEKHSLGYFPITFLKRKETFGETLNHLETDDRFDLNQFVPTRTHQLYEAKIEYFESLRQALIKNPDFVHVEVLRYHGT